MRRVALARLSLGLLQALTAAARLHVDSVMAGYTHHQHATISTFGHHLAAYAEAIRRVVASMALHIHCLLAFFCTKLAISSASTSTLGRERGGR